MELEILRAHLADYLGEGYLKKKMVEIRRASIEAGALVVPSKLKKLDQKAIREMINPSADHKMVCKVLGIRETVCYPVHVRGEFPVYWASMAGPLGPGNQLGYIQKKHIDWIYPITRNQSNVMPSQRPYIIATVTGGTSQKPSYGVNILIHNLTPTLEAMGAA